MTPENLSAPRPILFLDIDGVLNDHRPQPNGYCGILGRCVEQLNRVITATDPDIIVHSAWRYLVHIKAMTVDGFAALLATHGVDVYRMNGKIGHRVTAVTPMDLYGGSTDDRSTQILNLAPQQCWVAIDDLELQLPADRFVRTDGKKGLTEEDADRAICYLRT